MLVNHNGEIQEEGAALFPLTDRALLFGDGTFATMKYARGHIHFWEEHYFRLMASMRILRMDIPMTWSPEFLEEQILELIAANHWEKQAVRLRLSVFRTGKGRYLPEEPQSTFLIQAEAFPDEDYVLNARGLTVDVYRDHPLAGGLLSTLKTTNAQVQILASIYARENDLDAAVLVNTEKQAVEATGHNLFLLKDGVLFTAPMGSGAQKGIMREQVMRLAGAIGLETREEAFSPFELQRAEEVWLTNAVGGIKWVGQFRKKTYNATRAGELVDALNLEVSSK